MAGASYDDLPDAAVRVVLAVPLQTPSVVIPAAAPARVLSGGVVSHRRTASSAPSAASATSGRRRHARAPDPRAFPATVEASIVGLTAAGIVFATVAVVLMLIDLRLS